MTTPLGKTTQNGVPFTETVEAQGHLIDSHIMERIFDTVVEFGGRFEVEQFSIGRTNSDPSRLRLRIEAPNAGRFGQDDDADCWAWAARRWIRAKRNCERRRKTAARRKIFIPQPTSGRKCAWTEQWIEAANQRMDAMMVVGKDTAVCRRLRDVKAGDKIVVGMKGIRVIPEVERARPFAICLHEQRHFFGAAGGDSGGQTAAIMQQMRRDGKKIIAVAGPVVVHTGGAIRCRGSFAMAGLTRCLAGNALAVHDIESALLGTSLGVRTSDGRQAQHGHRNHMQAINAIYHEGSIEAGGGERALDEGRHV